MASIVPLGLSALFGINQSHPFFTAEHPFLTPGGWRALDRVATRLETPGWMWQNWRRVTC